jgi:hypothetical protein
MTDVALEMLRFLMLNENFFVVEFAVAIPVKKINKLEIESKCVGEFFFLLRREKFFCFGCITEFYRFAATDVEFDLPAPWLLCLKRGIK